MVATFGGLAGFSRYMRQSMLEVVRQDYIQTARAKGLSERVVIGKHALRNALLPVVTILGSRLPGLIGGSVIIESIFAIPGMGQLMVQAVFSRDYPVMMGNLVIVATLTLVANLVADIAYGLVDPRIRFARAAGEALSGGRRTLRGEMRQFWRTFSRNQLALCGGAVVAVLVILAVAGARCSRRGTRTGPTQEDPDPAVEQPLARHRSARPRRALAGALRLAHLARGGLRLGGDRGRDRGAPRRGGRLPRRRGRQYRHAAGGPDAGLPALLPACSPCSRSSSPRSGPSWP